MPAENIDEVIIRLESIVANAIQHNDRKGIFARLYLHVTRKVKEKIEENYFDDNKRMEKLDTLFANRYLEALENYHNGLPLSVSWLSAFDAAHHENLLTLQHLFLGMNAHINLDLGIAAAQTVLPGQIHELENDFGRINQLLIESIESVQDALNRISPLLFLLDKLGKKSDEHLAGFSLKKARAHAWQVALRMAKTPDNLKENQIAELDGYVSLLNKFITDPGLFLKAVIKLIYWFEEKDVGKVIKGLG